MYDLAFHQNGHVDVCDNGGRPVDCGVPGRDGRDCEAAFLVFGFCVCRGVCVFRWLFVVSDKC